jgi:RNA polymerase sigma factor (TIGR02999 family)
MSLPPKLEVTKLLRAWGQGDECALQRLVPAVHAELHRLAHKYMQRERPGHTLQTTALINEAYFRLVKSNQVKWRDRPHFFAVAATIMRRILIDFARSRLHQKRGGRGCRLSLDQVADLAVVTPPDVVALNDALNALAQLDQREGQSG